MTAAAARRMRSFLPGAAWPALPSAHGANLLSLLFQLDHTQWWTAQRLLQHQLVQLARVLRHARATVPFYRRQSEAAFVFDPPTLEAWRSLPLLRRRDVQSAGDDLVSRAVPPEHGALFELASSGSTGEPVRVRGTLLTRLFWEALTLREHEWHQRDFAAKLASVRWTTGDVGAPPGGTLYENWGTPSAEIYATGPSALLSLEADVAQQARWLDQQAPDYLLTYPTNLDALIGHYASRGVRPPGALREARTIAETVTPALRVACREVLGVPLVDLYSTQECGYVALQCPEAEHYHVMSESVFVEVLDARGRACGPGEIGRVVVTTLHNFATPLVRYELRDYARVGGPCPCGRGLPVLERILGRSRNMLTLPSGEQRWPVLGFAGYRAVAPIRQFQLVQHTLDEIEVRLVAERALAAAEEAELARVIRQALGHPFRLRYSYFAREIPRGAAGKFEEFVSNLAP
jgi:phenylacetate-CoA ligase